jgi:hypothetical protein
LVITKVSLGVRNLRLRRGEKRRWHFLVVVSVVDGHKMKERSSLSIPLSHLFLKKNDCKFIKMWMFYSIITLSNKIKMILHPSLVTQAFTKTRSQVSPVNCCSKKPAGHQPSCGGLNFGPSPWSSPWRNNYHLIFCGDVARFRKLSSIYPVQQCFSPLHHTKVTLPLGQTTTRAKLQKGWILCDITWYQVTILFSWCINISTLHHCANCNPQVYRSANYEGEPIHLPGPNSSTSLETVWPNTIP